MPACSLHGLAAFLQAHFQANFKMVLQKLRSIRFANVRRWPSADASYLMTDCLMTEF